MQNADMKLLYILQMYRLCTYFVGYVHKLLSNYAPLYPEFLQLVLQGDVLMMSLEFGLQPIVCFTPSPVTPSVWFSLQVAFALIDW